MPRYDLRLSNEHSVEIEHAELTEADLTNAISNGHWFTDKYGWKINPAHIVLIRKVVENVDRT